MVGPEDDGDAVGEAVGDMLAGGKLLDGLALGLLEGRDDSFFVGALVGVSRCTTNDTRINLDFQRTRRPCSVSRSIHIQTWFCLCNENASEGNELILVSYIQFSTCTSGKEGDDIRPTEEIQETEYRHKGLQHSL